MNSLYIICLQCDIGSVMNSLYIILLSFLSVSFLPSIRKVWINIERDVRGHEGVAMCSQRTLLLSKAKRNFVVC